MKKVIWIMLPLLLIGCADHAVQRQGTESVAYQEQHKFELSFESKEKKVEIARLEAIINQFDNKQARYDLYIPKQYQAQGTQVLDHMQSMKLRPDWVSSHIDEEGEALVLVVSQWSSVLDDCRPLTISKPQQQAGCAVETNRTIQLVNPGTRVN
ncbi:hypothetical protein BCS96_05335 [Vibrio breoganii]|uniref:hypothetical protein n=1 Tax=Vibrio breoganii TaxID=553239 RepID=UPI000C82A2D5|nr:hypothetical protein [Vibrio breoganii]PMG38777.1 hypothetical protein BCU93_13105 [Vibrio breoganii]PMK31963.1 hypothetical protein BCU03_06435 [Vibrio breoganii]PML82491.1 hypothetical protein BCT68_12635 [Vibrio breoganii]PMM26423.1 hypothetical protein BCT59_02970 [Vibrio breoganii]PMO61363.1 hypothetical protein BCT04_17625 [Vibrio breoganii]